MGDNTLDAEIDVADYDALWEMVVQRGETSACMLRKYVQSLQVMRFDSETEKQDALTQFQATRWSREKAHKQINEIVGMWYKLRERHIPVRQGHADNINKVLWRLSEGYNSFDRALREVHAHPCTPTLKITKYLFFSRPKAGSPCLWII